MKVPTYSKYKPSRVAWLGDIPEDWYVKRGRFCMEINPQPVRLRELNPDDEVSFVPMEAVGEHGGLNLEQTRAITDISSGYTEFEDGDVIVAKITPCFENGKGARAAGLTNGVGFGTTELHVLRARSVDRQFLFYLTISMPFRSNGRGEMYGAGGQKRVPPEFCKDFRVPLPRIEHQRTIANFLDRETTKIDALVAKKRALIEKLKEKRTALISRTVTRGLPPDAARAAGLERHPKMKPSGVAWLGDVPEHWRVPPLYTRYSIKLGKMLDERRITGNHLVHYLRNVDVQWDRVEIDDLPEMDISKAERDRYTVKSGDLLVCEGGEVGRAGTVSDRAAGLGFQKALHRMRPLNSSEISRFMFYTLLWASQTGIFFAEGNPNTIDHLTGEKLRRYRFSAPPRFEQLALADFLDRETTKIDQMVTKVEAAIERLREYRAALITAAVTGKIDVRGAAA